MATSTPVLVRRLLDGLAALRAERQRAFEGDPQLVGGHVDGVLRVSRDD